MDATHDLVHRSRGKEGEPASNDFDNNQSSIASHGNRYHLPKLVHYKWWLRVITYILFLLVGQTSATLLGRLYFDEGGNSKWMATFVQSAGFPIIIPLLIFFRKSASSAASPSLRKLMLLYFGLGLGLTVDNLLYSYGLVYLPVSTYSLLCATQLAFNAVTSYFMNSQKFTILVLNSLVLLTVSACLLAINADNEKTLSNISKGKYIIGFLCTVGASALYSLFLSLVQLCFDRVIKNDGFSSVLSIQLFPAFVATCACVVGLFASGEWRSLTQEMNNYKKGRVSYAMTLAWTAITWQFSSLGLLGLIFEVSSLFSNVISTLSLPLVPIFAVVFFHDKMGGVKVISLVLALWGFISYIYQHYLDDTKDSEASTRRSNEVPSTTIEMC